MDRQPIKKIIKKVVHNYLDRHNDYNLDSTFRKKRSNWVITYEISINSNPSEIHKIFDVPGYNETDAEFILADFFKRTIGEVANVDFKMRALKIEKQHE